ncbi:MAG: response regulator [Deltaproteobacteria bacterium]|nr:response regulator [Deltaproteobacteria bacterium]
MNKKILIVDDEQTIAKALSRLFSKHGFETHIAHDGKKALVFFKDHPFDLVLLDVILPKLNGIAVLEYIRKKNKKIPIIMMTAYSNVESLKEAQKLGANDALFKPFDNIDDVLKKVKKYVSLC